MKIFKRIYYPVMAALVVLMLVLGIVDSHVGGGSGLKKSQELQTCESSILTSVQDKIDINKL